ncbi:HTH-type transcriptional regulator PuuR [Delftia tsuruhatensis]|nr:HTH-type transcriptional regulator PuuR [Delftia tsuruhatensis]
MERGLTLEQLAAQAGVSRAMISKIERGQSSPTAVLLSRIGDAMGLSLSSLMSERRPGRPAMRCMQEQPVWTDPQTGYTRRLVSPAGDNGDTEIVAVELPAGATVTFPATQSLHSQDQVLVLEGRLTLRGDAAVFELEAGDCARISTRLESSFGNTGKLPARYLVVKRHYL